MWRSPRLRAAGVFVEPLHPVARLLVLGGGHIAQPLVAIASLLEYEMTVIDDRPSFADHRRFPGARSVVCDDFSRALSRQRFDAGTSVVIVTRGHLHDLECLKQVLPAEPGYVGMIGSRALDQTGAGAPALPPPSPGAGEPGVHADRTGYWR